MFDGIKQQDFSSTVLGWGGNSGYPSLKMQGKLQHGDVHFTIGEIQMLLMKECHLCRSKDDYIVDGSNSICCEYY